MATISRLLKITGLFCRISPLLQGSFAEETYNFKEPTNRSHPTRVSVVRSAVVVKLSDMSTVMEWQRLLDSVKLWVSFAEELYKRDDILPKRPIILRSLLVVATP